MPHLSLARSGRAIVTLACLCLSIAAAAAPPVVKTVPWVASNPLIPHDTWSGKTVTLKGTADVQGTGIEYVWDYGDGTPVASGSVGNRFAIEARHAYVGDPGDIFTARLTVTDADTGESDSAIYLVQIRERTLDIEVNVAIDEGLWYLHKTQRRSSENGVDFGDWNQSRSCGSRCASSTWYGNTAANLNALAANGHVPYGDPANPYVDTAARALRRVFTYLRTEPIGPRTYPPPTNTVDPDSNGNGYGVRVDQRLYVYQGGIFMDAIIAAGRPDDITTTGDPGSGNDPGIRGRRFDDILQDMVDSYAFGQYNANSTRRGGWRYVWNEAPDNSANQWAAIGMIPAERNWGLMVPQWVKTENEVWLAYSRNSTTGSFGYADQNASSWGPYAVTPSGMVQLIMSGIGRGDPRWDGAETYLRDRFANNTSRAETAIRDNYYGLLSFVKAMQLHDPNGDGVADPIELLSSQSAGVPDLDWYADPAIGVARTLVNDQEGGGFWYSFGFREHNYSGDQYSFETAWAILMLSRTLFEAGSPVAVAQAIPNPGIAGQPIELDGATSFHQDAQRRIVGWEWDLDNDGTYDVSGPRISTSFPAVGDYPVSLRVHDDATPSRSATTTLTVRIDTPPLAPTADAGGPYSFCPGQTWFLDGSGSVNPDDGLSEPGSPPDRIETYLWDLDGDGAFDDASGVQADVSAYFTTAGPGDYLVRLEVTDRSATAYPSSTLGDLSDTDSAQISVRDASDARCTCVSDLSGRAKRGKVSLTWADSGADHYNVYRSLSRGGPFTRIATTTSRYSTYLDADLPTNTTYFYVVREADAADVERCQSNEAAVRVSPRGSTDRISFLTSPVTQAIQGMAYVYDADAISSSSTGSLLYSLSQAPQGMSIDPITGLVTWIPGNAQVGDLNVVITAEVAALGISADQVFVVNVTNTNDAPRFVSQPTLTATEGQPYAYTAQAQDPDAGEVLRFELLQGPPGATIDPDSGAVSWTPGAADVGSQRIVLAVRDLADAADVQDFVVDVAAANQAPFIITSPVIGAAVGAPYLYRVQAVDRNEADVLTFALEVAPTGMSVDPNSGEIRWTPVQAQVGDANVTVAVSDGALGSTQSFQVTVSDVNDAPVIVSTPPLDAREGDLYVYDVETVDPDVGDAPRFSLARSPRGMSINASSGLVQWTPGPQQSGEVDVVVRVTDAADASAEQAFTLTVEDVNDAPVIFSQPETRARVGVFYEYAVRTDDADGDAVSLELLAGPAGMVLEPTGVLRWRPVVSQVGRHDVSVRASDGRGGTAEQRYSIEVDDPVDGNHLPVADAGPNRAVVTGSTVNLDGTASFDSDEQFLTYAWRFVELPAGTSTALSGATTATPAFVADVAGLYVVELVVNDAVVDSDPDLVTIEAAAALTTAPDVSGLSLPAAVALLENAGFRVVVEERFDDGAVAGALLGQQPAPGSDVAVGGTVLLVASLGPAPSNPPIITLHAPVANSVLGNRVDVVASIADDDLVSYRVEVGRADRVDINQPTANDPDYRVLAEGNAPVSNTVVGRFDPTLLSDDAYVLRVIAEDALGDRAAVAIDLTVAGGPKLGRFSLEVSDLEVPLAGIPIEILRRYDTLDGADVGDFGHGWRLAMRGADIRTNTPNRGNTFLFPTPFRDDRSRVFLTTPDGRRVGFTFELVQTANTLLGPQYSPRFRPDPGVYERLESTDGNGALARAADGTAGIFFFGLPWRPSGYELVTRDNLRYRYSDTGVVQSITDPDGNRVTVSGAGISHSLGESIDFVRDGLGRIARIVDPDGGEIVYAYDASGDLIAVTDQAGDTTQYGYLAEPAHYLDEIIDARGRLVQRTEYDADGRLVAVIDANGDRIEQDIDLDARLFATTDASGNRTLSEYDARGNAIRIVDPEGGETRYAYEDPLNPDLETSRTDPNGNITRFAYDDRGNLTQATDALGRVTTWSYNEFNRVTSITDPLGRTETVVFDDQGRATTATLADGSTVGFEYDAAGRPSRLTNANGNAVTYSYDPSNRPVTVTYADGASRTLTYDFRGGILSETDEIGATSSYEYDETGRPELEIDPMGATTALSYDGPDLITATDPLGRATVFEHDDDGTYRSRTDAGGNTIEYDYDADGRVTGYTDELGNETSMAYDGNGRLIARTDALGRSIVYAYDAGGRLIRRTDRRGNVVRVEYDAADRVVREVWETATGDLVNSIDITYDDGDRVITISDDFSSYALDWNARDQLTRIDNQGTPGVPRVVLDYEYDGVGNLVRTEDDDGVVVRIERSSRDVPVALRWTGTAIEDASLDMQRNPRNEVLRTEYFVGLPDPTPDLLTESTYYPDGRPQRLSHSGRGGSLLADYLYSYDAAGQPTRIVTDRDTRDYAHDASGQLTSADSDVYGLETYTYDDNYNLLARAGDAQQAVVQPGNRLASTAEFILEHDEEGNVSGKEHRVSGEYVTFDYDHRNRLTRIRSYAARNGALTDQVNYVYDVFNRRIQRDQGGSSTTTVFSGPHPWVEFEPSESPRHYLYGDDADQLIARQRDGDIRWYLRDRIGSVDAIADEDGDLLARVIRDDFGRTLAVDGDATALDRFGFTSREHEPVADIYYYRSRYYDPSLGRFLGEDSLFYTDRIGNLYAYVGNRPHMFSDPYGFVSTISYARLQTAFAALRACVLREIGTEITIELVTTVAGLDQPGLYFFEDTRFGKPGTYVGQTSREIQQRIAEHGDRVRKAIGAITVKSGFSNADAPIDKYLRQMEQFLIDYFDGPSGKRNGTNLGRPAKILTNLRNELRRNKLDCK